MSEITDAEVIEYFNDVGDIKSGEYLKHDACFATRTLDVTQTDVDECPALAPYLGLQLSQEGTQSYKYGWDTCDDITVFRKVANRTPVCSEFWGLMSHLNAEDNELAAKFARKYLPDATVYEEVK